MGKPPKPKQTSRTVISAMQQQLRRAQCWGRKGDDGHSAGHGEGSSNCGTEQGQAPGARPADGGAPEECSAHRAIVGTVLVSELTQVPEEAGLIISWATWRPGAPSQQVTLGSTLNSATRTLPVKHWQGTDDIGKCTSREEKTLLED
ncbi:hypothetical protein R6Z07F_003061 [Ovis aries]